MMMMMASDNKKKKKSKREGYSCGSELMDKEEIPEDIILQEIMWRLPIKPLARFRSVSKTFNSVISSDPKFAILQLNNNHHSSSCPIITTPCLDRQRLMLWDDLNPSSAFFLDKKNSAQFSLGKVNGNPIKMNGDSISSHHIVASCDGLVCILDHNEASILFWNPLTGETKRISDPPAGIPLLSKRNTYGLGYDSSTDDYKLVWINVRVKDVSTGLPLTNEVGVFSLRTNSWRQIQDFPIRKVCSSIPGVFINGALYWSGYSKDSHRPSSRHYKIVSFCLEKETYRLLDTPLVNVAFFRLAFNRCHIQIQALGGKLAVYYPSIKRDFQLLLTTVGDNGSSWTKHTVELPNLKWFAPLCVWEHDGEILFRREDGRLGLYCLKTKKFCDILISGLPISFSTMTFSESLISPNTFRGKRTDIKNMEAVKKEVMTKE